MSDTTLSKLGYPRVDKLCNAKFIDNLVKSTKKDFSLFVSTHDGLGTFFKKIEERLDDYDEKILGFNKFCLNSVK